MTNTDLTKNSVWRNKKNRIFYQVLNPAVLDCTNSRDGAISVLYTVAGDLVLPSGTPVFVRERTEFLEKFEHCPTGVKS